MISTFSNHSGIFYLWFDSKWLICNAGVRNVIINNDWMCDVISWTISLQRKPEVQSKRQSYDFMHTSRIENSRTIVVRLQRDDYLPLNKINLRGSRDSPWEKTVQGLTDPSCYVDRKLHGSCNSNSKHSAFIAWIVLLFVKIAIIFLLKLSYIFFKLSRCHRSYQNWWGFLPNMLF